jgi:hypothetical protein
MTAANYNLTIDQGSDFALTMTVKEGGVAKDLTGYSARAQLRTRKSDASAAATFTCSVLSPASSGQVKLELDNSTSTALSAGRYFYDLEIYTASDAIVKRLLQGEVNLTPEVTK